MERNRKRLAKGITWTANRPILGSPLCLCTGYPVAKDVVLLHTQAHQRIDLKTLVLVIRADSGIAQSANQDSLDRRLP